MRRHLLPRAITDVERPLGVKLGHALGRRQAAAPQCPRSRQAGRFPHLAGPLSGQAARAFRDLGLQKTQTSEPVRGQRLGHGEEPDRGPLMILRSTSP